MQAIQLRHCRLKFGNFGLCRGEVAIGGGHSILRFAGQFGQRLLKEFDISL